MSEKNLYSFLRNELSLIVLNFEIYILKVTGFMCDK